MEVVFKKVERGINVDGERLTYRPFEDDVALTTSIVKDMETLLHDLNKESKKVCLKMHKGKTKYMANFKTDETIEVKTKK